MTSESSQPTNVGSNDQLGPLVEELARRTAWRYAHSREPHHSDTYTFNRACLLDFAKKLVAAESERRAKLCQGEHPEAKQQRTTRVTTAAELRQQANSDMSCVGAFARARPGKA